MTVRLDADDLPEPRLGCPCMACQHRGAFLNLERARQRRELILHDLLLERARDEEAGDAG